MPLRERLSEAMACLVRLEALAKETGDTFMRELTLQLRARVERALAELDARQ